MSSSKIVLSDWSTMETILVLRISAWRNATGHYVASKVSREGQTKPTPRACHSTATLAGRCSTTIQYCVRARQVLCSVWNISQKKTQHKQGFKLWKNNEFKHSYRDCISWLLELKEKKKTKKAGYSFFFFSVFLLVNAAGRRFSFSSRQNNWSPL